MVANFTWVNIATFNLPNCNYHNPYHDPNVALGHYHSGYVPNIVGTLKTTGSLGGDQQSSTSGGTGALTSLKTDSSFNYGTGGRGNQTNGISFDASRVSDAYWNSRTVLAAGVNMNWVIKY